jgi:hypothetical protein
MTLSANKRAYDCVIPYLTGKGDFKLSKEFGDLRGTGDDLPGVVTSAYARYICNVLSTSQSSELARSLLEPINEFCRWDDLQLNSLIRDEFFERIITCKNINEIKNAMSEELACLFAQWSGDNSGDTILNREHVGKLVKHKPVEKPE